MSFVDLLTIVPYFVTLLASGFNFTTTYFRIFRIFRALAVLRLYRIIRSYDGYDYELAVLVFTIVTVIFVAASAFHLLEEPRFESEGVEFEFHHAVYFVFVTLSTVGFGDITPQTTGSQFIVMIMIIAVVLVIPRQINRLTELSKLQHACLHSYKNREDDGETGGGHVIVTGRIQFESIVEFLSEFYCERHGRVQMDVVILADEMPSDRLQHLLQKKRYQRRTTYLKGTLLNEKDVKRAKVAQAAAVFILAEKKSTLDADEQDASTILQALALDRFRFQRHRMHFPSNNNPLAVKNNRTIRCFVQVVAPLRSRGLRTITGVEVALNTPRLRMAILARSLVCPGVVALLLNLIYSVSDKDLELAKQLQAPWTEEYRHGLEHQLFPGYLPCKTHGVLYETVASKLFEQFHVLFIALYNRPDSGFLKRVSLCPFRRELRDGDLGFFIAPSAACVRFAIDSLVIYESNAPRKPPAGPPPLFISSDSVLDRQSFELLDERDLLECPSVVRSPGGASTDILDDISQTHVNEGSARSMGSRYGSLRRVDSTIGRDHLKKLHDHVIVCGPFEQGYQMAIYIDEMFRREGPASSTYLIKRPTILIMVKQLPTDTDYAHLPYPLPENVYVEKGYSHHVEDLMRVRAFRARHVLFLPGSWKCHMDDFPTANSSGGEQSTEPLIDYQVIMSTLSLRTVEHLYEDYKVNSTAGANLHQMRSSLSCVSAVMTHQGINYFGYKGDQYKLQEESFVREISQANNGSSAPQLSTIRSLAQFRLALKFGDLQEEYESTPPCFVPCYAAGEVFVESILDTLLCQSFFNPYVIDLIRAMAGDYYHNERGSRGPTHAASSWRHYFEESSLSDKSSDSSDQRFSKREGTSPNSDSLEYPILSVAKVAGNLVGRSFVDVFKHALQNDMFPIGLYRAARPTCQGNSQPYVYLSPSQQSIVHKEDLVYVITRKLEPLEIS